MYSRYVVRAILIKTRAPKESTRITQGSTRTNQYPCANRLTWPLGAYMNYCMFG